MAVSEPLQDDDVRALFPSGPLQCWDSDLMYTYFRLTGDQRLLVGGGSALTTFALQYVTSPRVIAGVLRRLKKKIPRLDHVKFVQYWPGFIDTTDLFVGTSGGSVVAALLAAGSRNWRATRTSNPRGSPKRVGRHSA